MKNPQAYRVYLILSGASTFFNAVMFTVLTVYYVTVAGLNPLELVLVGTIMEIATFLFEIPTGIVADTYSRRLSVIIGMFVTGVGFLIVGFSSTFWAIAGGLAVWGIGSTFISGAREAWIVDEVGEAHIDQVFMRTTQLRNVAKFVGVFVSVGLASLSLNLPIILGASATILLGGYLIFAMPETGWKPAEEQRANPWQAMGSTFTSGIQMTRQRPIMLWFLGIAIIFGAYSEVFDRLGEAHFLVSFDFPELGSFEPVVWFGVLQAGAQLFGFVAAGLSARLNRLGWLRLDEPNRAMTALSSLQVLWIVGVIGFGLAGSFWLALGCFWFIGVIQTLWGPIYSAWQNRNIDSSVRATALSFINQSDSLGQMTGGPLIGGVGTIFSLRVAMVVAGLVLAPAFALYRKGTSNA